MLGSGVMRLSCLNEGAFGTIKRLDGDIAISRRFCELGLIKGTKIKCLFASPMGDPRAYLIKNKVFSVRKCDADNIILE